jgi:FkbM family methyltransferase
MKESLLDCPALAGILSNTGITLVDIGARDSALKQFRLLAPFASYYACEPDVQEAERLRLELPDQFPWRAAVVIGEAIASRQGQTVLYLTRQPGMSSLLETDLRVAGRYCVGPKFEPASQVLVPAIPLDEAAVKYGFRDASFLKLDTQGTELDILESGTALLPSLLGIHTESLLQPFYRGQSLFADVDAFLRLHGFTLFSLCRTAVRRAGYRAELFSRRVVVWAHCLYFREPGALPPAGVERREALVRLLGLALAFHHNDLAFEVLGIMGRESVVAGDVFAALTREVEALVSRRTRRLQAKLPPGDGQTTLLASSVRDNRDFG